MMSIACCGKHQAGTCITCKARFDTEHTRICSEEGGIGVYPCMGRVPRAWRIIVGFGPDDLCEEGILHGVFRQAYQVGCGRVVHQVCVVQCKTIRVSIVCLEEV